MCFVSVCLKCVFMVRCAVSLVSHLYSICASCFVLHSLLSKLAELSRGPLSEQFLPFGGCLGTLPALSLPHIHALAQMNTHTHTHVLSPSISVPTACGASTLPVLTRLPFSSLPSAPPQPTRAWWCIVEPLPSTTTLYRGDALDN